MVRVNSGDEGTEMDGIVEVDRQTWSFLSQATSILSTTHCHVVDGTVGLDQREKCVYRKRAVFSGG